MKPYLLFQGEHYYPAGGIDDLRGSYDTVEEAQAATDGCDSGDWMQIVEYATMKAVLEGDNHWRDGVQWREVKE